MQACIHAGVGRLLQTCPRQARRGSTAYIPVGVSINDGGVAGIKVNKVAEMRLSPRRHSSASWHPGRRAGTVNGRQVLPDVAFGSCLCCHSRLAGMCAIHQSSFQRKLESRKAGRDGEWVADFAGCRVRFVPVLSCPLCGNSLLNQCR